jgi:hypothetical protein
LHIKGYVKSKNVIKSRVISPRIGGTQERKAAQSRKHIRQIYAAIDSGLANKRLGDRDGLRVNQQKSLTDITGG